jgi:APA family basic amino acid/polyamine antiporter
LLPRGFAVVHPRYSTPHRTTLTAAVFIAVTAGVLPIDTLARLINMGVLCAFLVVCSAIVVLRRRRPDLPRAFRTPLVPFVPLIGIGFSLWLIVNLPRITWFSFAAWLAVGLIVYFAYGRRNSVLAT